MYACTHENLVCLHVHHGLYELRACIFGLHKLHGAFGLCVFPTHFACFIGMHTGLAYTRITHSKPNTCMRTYVLLHHGEYTFYRFIAANVNSVSTLSKKFTVSYGDMQMTTCILRL